MKRRIVSLLVSVAMLVTLMPTVFAENTDGSYDVAYTAASGVTRAEWISSIVETFQMTVESDAAMPDNYFSDITSDDPCYYDLLLAVEFGVIDIEAGEAFEPNKAVTREFAAQTLNFALGFRLDETQEYTYNESSDVAYPDDIQIAVNRGWFALSGGNFLPEREITAAEAAAMLADAKNVLSEEAVDENYNSTYEFAEGVIVVPEAVETAINADNSVIIYDNATGINKGDVFAVYTSGFPVAFTALEVEVSETKTVIQTTREGAEEAIDYVDCEGAIEVDVEDFQFEDYATYSITDTSKANAESEEMTVELSGVSYDEKSKTVTVSQKISVGDSAAGTVSIKVKNPKLVFKSKGGLTQVYVTADTSVTTSVSFDFGNYAGIPPSLVLGAVPIAGIGTISLEIEYSLKGGVTLSWDGAVKAGFSVKGFDVKVIKSYTKKDFSFSAYAQIKAGVRLAVAYDVLFSKGVIYASVGVKAGIELHTYDSGTPKKCVTIKGHLYARIGMDVSVLGQSIPIEPYDIYNESNSPVRVVNHYEDDVAVSSCSRGHSLKYVTSPSSYYYNPSSPYGSGSYGGGGTVAPVVIWEYEVEDGNATITKYNGTASAVVIPSTLDGYTVTKIGNYAFYNNKSIRSVAMANTITEIGDSVFGGCSNLSGINLPPNIVTIGALAFTDCSSLTEIYIPKTLSNSGWAFYGSGIVTAEFEKGMTVIPEGVFEYAGNLKNVTIPDTVITIGNSAFGHCTSLETVSIPNSVTEIEINAFYSCNTLQEVALPLYLEEIGFGAFSKCESLEKIEIPKSLKRVNTYSSFSSDAGVFYGCSNLNDITFETGTTSVINYLFYGCNYLKSIYLPDSITTIGDNAFSNCTALENVKFSDNITKIGGYAFGYCISLSNIKLPEYLIKIDDRAFSNCRAITTLNIPKYVTSIGIDAFANCINLQQAELSSSLEEIGFGAFTGCDSLESIEIPKTLKKINSYQSWSQETAGPFYNCSNLKKITLENGITVVPRYLFCACKLIEEVKIPNTVTNIESNAFVGCSSLKNVLIPSSVTKLGADVFNNCTSLKSISIPDSVTEMDNYVFSGCTSLENVKLPSAQKSITFGMFENCSSLKEIELPNTVTNIQSYAFSGCTALENIKLSDSLTKIQDSAFKDCTSLASISIPEGVTSIGSSAFENCDSLTDVNININGSIGSRAFYDCDGLTSLRLGDGVTSIGSSMCYGCDSLSDISFGKYIETIPDSSFRLCQSLTSVTLPRFCTTVAANAFAEDTKLMDIYAPVTVSKIENNSFSYPAKMTMHGKSGTYAQEYAGARNMNFSAETKPITSIAYEDQNISISRYAKVRPMLNIAPEFDTSVVTFSSSDESVLTVSNTGEVYGKNYGTARITATTDSGRSDSIDITVLKTVTSIGLSENTLEIKKGGTGVLTATVKPSDAADILTWSSSNPDVATVDNNGNITALSVGTAVITVTASYSKVSASCTVTVFSQPEVTEFTVKDMGGYYAADLTAADIPGGATVWIGAYSGGNYLLTAEEVTLSDGAAHAEIHTSGATMFKVFVWDENTMEPITESVEVNL